MRNLIDLKRPPQEAFLHLTQDRGVQFLEQPQFFWRAMKPAEIHGFAASEHAAINERIEGFLSFNARFRRFSQAIEVNSVPVLVSNADFRKSYVTVGEKCVLSGASGIRLLNRYCWENEGSEPAPEAALIEYFNQRQAEKASGLSIIDATPAPETPFAIECRNTFNYYHFVTESLCQLCDVAESGSTGPIYLHFPNQEDKTREFTRNFIAALFPELLHRVRFQRSPYRHDRAFTSYNFLLDCFSLPASQYGSLQEIAPDNPHWKAGQASMNALTILEMNAVDSNLRRLRERALRAIEGKDFSHLPRRFWVGRQAGRSRERPLGGEAELVEMLQQFGFAQVLFENLTPLEQIGLMANAEMMISHHGAGFTNMLFASPQATVIELGTLQTARYRWGDFHAVANVSGCRYVSFFADYNTDTPLVDPVFSLDGIVPVHLSRSGLAQVMCFVVASLGKIPHLTQATDVARLASQLLVSGDVARAGEVIDQHLGMEEGHVGLSLVMADIYEKQNEPADQMAALYTAFRADPTQHVTLIKVIWCARKLNDLDTLRAALSLLRDTFPDRFHAFIKDRPWFQKQIKAA